MDTIDIANFIIQRLQEYDRANDTPLANYLYYFPAYEGNKVIANAILELEKKGHIIITRDLGENYQIH